MFRKDISPSQEQDKVNTLIGVGTEIKGSIKATGGIRIDGRVDGEILHEGDLVVGEEGYVEASVKTRNATIAGEVRGNIEASGRVEIVSTGKILGDIIVTTLVINEGAVFDGTCQMRQASAAEGQGRRSIRDRIQSRHEASGEVAAGLSPDTERQ
ncbi:MAG: polymer-forming cytoskeletal protein [Bacillota bacterium]|jgi:cytoskeletal protein CcmA (bactofilin family)|nr:MAG: polymer-forming cytoskeletal protein [Bacillota bacterium]